MDEYFERFGGVRDYLRGVVDEARRTGFTETILGRRRYLPDLTSDNRQRREMAERMALNAPIQGSAADIIKVAMLNVDRALRDAGLASRMLLQVHDELVFEVAAGEERGARGAGPPQMGAAAEPDGPARRVRRHRPQLARRRALIPTPGPSQRAVRTREPPEAQPQQRDEQHGVHERDDVEQLPDGARGLVPRPPARRARPRSGRPTSATAGPPRCRRAAAARRARCRGPRRPTAGPGSRRTRGPPMNIRVTPLSSPGGQRADDAERHHHGDAAQQGRAPGRLGRHRRERDHDHELRQEQHAFTRIRPPAYRPDACGVEHDAGEDHVGVGEGEEGEQRVRVARGLAQDRRSSWCRRTMSGTCAVRGSPQGQPADDRRRGEPDRHAQHGPNSVGRQNSSSGADHQPRDTGREVDEGQGRPTSLALEDAGLATHDRHRHATSATQRRGRQAVEVQSRVDHRRQRQAQHGHADRRCPR